MKLSEKVRAIREAEGLSQTQFCKVLDLSISTLKKYESGAYEPSGLNLVKLTQHPLFYKYTLWLMTDKISPQAGQIAPAIAHNGQESATSTPSEKQTG
ncbi:transcriptional regulator [Kosakonia sp. H7A]|uniref:helix-turn-helix domain-containing protein n=1 Tax=Kosakonia sp. H7A TaxID=2054598 RepID=UPI000D176FF8|nr:helix-turn-helix domain-containing protein [Kosakonia sp. H7A]PTA87881.1 transcriptional regulator [Kosakonia sp. H7A]